METCINRAAGNVADARFPNDKNSFDTQPVKALVKRVEPGTDTIWCHSNKNDVSRFKTNA
jgi:hypothetical protein